MPKAKSSTPLKIEMWDIGKVLKYAKNPKNHSDLQIAMLAESMKQFGFVNPVLVDANDTLIAGHGRILGASSIGMKTVPVIRLGHLSEDQARALRIADNSLGTTGTSWDAELLQVELDQLTAMNFDLAPLGLDTIEFDELEDAPAQAPRSPRSKTTIFLSVKNEIAEKARKTVVATLNKAKIEHNL